MSRILLADDSPHAQRMGERLLRDEGHEVVTITNGETVFVRLPDVDPDILILDANLPVHSGYEIAEFVKQSPFYRHAGVVLTGSLADPVDEELALSCGADGQVHKPFEAKGLLSLITQLAAKAETLRALRPAGPPPPRPGTEPVFVQGVVDAEPEPEFALDAEIQEPPMAPPVPQYPQLAPLGVKSIPENEPEVSAVLDVSEEERVRAAVTLALDTAMPQLIDELTQQVLRALHSK